MLPAGKRDRRLKLQRAYTQKNSLNEEVQTWVTLATVWAEKLDVSDGERVQAAEVGANLTTRFRILHSSTVADLNPRDRCVLGSLVYDIVGCKEIGTREGIEITANARPDLVE
jgi:SPP1 family predicted phage head-tail adaptor